MEYLLFHLERAITGIGKLVWLGNYLDGNAELAHKGLSAGLKGRITHKPLQDLEGFVKYQIAV